MGYLPAGIIGGTLLGAEAHNDGPTNRNNRHRIDIPITRQPQYTGVP
jgi:hypothetical protein